MTEADALTAIKTECKVLSDSLTDTELLYFLNKNSKDNGDGDKLYNLNRAAYEALDSALTAMPKSFSRGGVSYTRDDFKETLKTFQRKAMVGNSDFPGTGIGVIVRDIPG